MKNSYFRTIDLELNEKIRPRPSNPIEALRNASKWRVADSDFGVPIDAAGAAPEVGVKQTEDPTARAA